MKPYSTGLLLFETNTCTRQITGIDILGYDGSCLFPRPRPSAPQSPAALLRCFIGQIKRFRVPSSSSSRAPPGPGVPTPDTSGANCKLFCPETVWWRLRRKSALTFCVQVSAPATVLLLGRKCRDNGHKMSSNFCFPIKYTWASTLKGGLRCVIQHFCFIMHAHIFYFTFHILTKFKYPRTQLCRNKARVESLRRT